MAEVIPCGTSGFNRGQETSSAVVHSEAAAAPIVFCDTETTHTHPGWRRPWEIALIRREPDGAQRQVAILIIQDIDVAHADPKALEVGGFYRRHPRFASIPMGGDPNLGMMPGRLVDPARLRDTYYMYEADAAAVVDAWTTAADGGRVQLAGYNTWFDAATLEAMLRRHMLVPRWDYHLIDVGNMTIGRLGTPQPMSGEALSRAVGVEPPGEAERHHALGDARWVMRWWDQLTGPVLDSSK